MCELDRRTAGLAGPRRDPSPQGRGYMPCGLKSRTAGQGPGKGRGILPGDAREHHQRYSEVYSHILNSANTGGREAGPPGRVSHPNGRSVLHSRFFGKPQQAHNLDFCRFLGAEKTECLKQGGGEVKGGTPRKRHGCWKTGHDWDGGGACSERECPRPQRKKNSPVAGDSRAPG